MSPKEKQTIEDITQALTDEDVQIVVKNLPLKALKGEEVRRNNEANKVLMKIALAFDPYYERELTLEEKIAVIQNVQKAARACPPQ